MDKLKFILISSIGLLASLYTLYFAFIYFNQADMVFIHSSLDKDYKFEFQTPFQEKTIKSFDGKKQHGLLFSAKEPKGIIFYLHGNAGNVSNWGNISAFYNSLDYDIFILDYRSFGKSEGQIDDEKQISKDVQIVFDKITQNYSNKIIIGYSIGTGIASQLAVERNAKMLILQAPYDNFLKFSGTRVPFFPDMFKKFKFETDKKIKHIKCLIYLFHGKDDKLISIDNSYRLEKFLKVSDTLYVLNNQDHIGINENYEFRVKLKNLLK
ncbi:alpha/beta hydrolase [Flavobacterium sp. H122]|uniref:alpha/beta hydrolase n=1 Tax=Flavobacterium sp. H122 TaxID=2529860 RepID=UPI0010AA6B0F|nr:alpha/beta fold hydrolase [Flavobacterium sp. H122]